MNIAFQSAKLLKIVHKTKHFAVFFVYHQDFLYFCAHKSGIGAKYGNKYALFDNK